VGVRTRLPSKRVPGLDASFRTLAPDVSAVPVEDPVDRLGETYVAALQHDLYEPAPDERLVGVVRRPTRWLNAAVDENVRALGPPAALLDAFRERIEELELRGLCEAEAHNAAWDEVDYERRYRAHLRSGAAGAAVDDLLARLRDGERL
jgi:hypothetical protein